MADVNTELDDDLVPEVLALIEELGKEVQIRTSTLTPNPATRAVVESNVQVVTRKVSPPSECKFTWRDGKLVKLGDCYVYVAASGLTIDPVQGSKVIFSDQTWTVVEQKPIRTGKLIAAYKLTLKR